MVTLCTAWRHQGAKCLRSSMSLAIFTVLSQQRLKFKVILFSLGTYGKAEQDFPKYNLSKLPLFCKFFQPHVISWSRQIKSHT